MTSEHEIVRTGSKRSARRGRRVLFLLGITLLITTVARAKASVSAWRVQDAGAAQDTAQLNELLAKVRGVDPMVCQLVGRSLDNRWGPNSGGLMVSVNGPTLDQAAVIDWVNSARIERALVPILRAGIANGDACVRQTSAHLLGRAQVVDLSAELRGELSSNNPRTREAAVIALGYFDRQSGLNDARRA